MKCLECQREGVRSKVFVGVMTSTLMHCPGFYDEEGVYHIHDMNEITTSYTCARGLCWAGAGDKSCPNCDWSG